MRKRYAQTVLTSRITYVFPQPGDDCPKLATGVLTSGENKDESFSNKLGASQGRLSVQESFEL